MQFLYTILTFAVFSFPCFSCTVNFTVTVIATSTHSSSFPSPLPSHLLIVTPQLSPCPLTPSLSHFPFNTCQLLPARLSIEHHKKVTSLFFVFLSSLSLCYWSEMETLIRKGGGVVVGRVGW